MRQLLSALSYFSIFFAPFLFPIIIWIVAKDDYIEGHAKRALFSHVFPFLAAIPLFYFFVTAHSLGSAVGFVILFFESEQLQTLLPQEQLQEKLQRVQKVMQMEYFLPL